LRLIIRQHTREAGVRNLERHLAGICRRTARRIVERKVASVRVTPQNLKDFLGPAQFLPDMSEAALDPGVATALAWTSTGGEILFVEATQMHGRGNLLLTGSLGEVMRESAQAAVSYIRSHGATLGIDPQFFEKSDLHIHVPAGAIPKDGPSAGVTIAVALASLLARKPVAAQTAMTGEITLRGKVLPVGGIKEKVLAASRSGVTTVVLPEQNRKDLTEIPSEVRRKIRFRFVRTLEQAMRATIPGLRLLPLALPTRGNAARPQPGQRRAGLNSAG
jgi:ATP-dependent Lon protease